MRRLLAWLGAPAELAEKVETIHHHHHHYHHHRRRRRRRRLCFSPFPRNNSLSISLPCLGASAHFLSRVFCFFKHISFHAIHHAAIITLKFRREETAKKTSEDLREVILNFGSVEKYN